MRNHKFISFGFLFSLFMAIGKAYGTPPIDLTLHLTGTPTVVVDPTKTTEVHSSTQEPHGVDSYVVLLPDGISYDLEFCDRPRLISVLTSMQLIANLGLPVRPHYPVFVQRGMNGVPSLAETKALKPNIRPENLALARDAEWAAAIVSPISHSYDLAYDRAKAANPTVEYLTERAIATWVNYVLGYNLSVWTTKDNNIIVSPDAYVMLGRHPSQAKEMKKPFAEWLRSRQRGHAPLLSTQDIASLAKEPKIAHALASRLYSFGKRLEAFSKGDEGNARLKAFLRPVLEASGHVQPDYLIGQIQSMIVGSTTADPVSGLIASWLKTLHENFRAVNFSEYHFAEMKYAAVNPLDLLERTRRLAMGQKVTLTPKEVLLGYWMADSSLRPSLLRSFKTIFPGLSATDESQLLAALMIHAADTDVTRLVAHEGDIQGMTWHARSDRAALDQAYLNNKRPKTLVVVRPVTREYEMVSQVATDLGTLLNTKDSTKIEVYPTIKGLKHTDGLPAVFIRVIVEYAVRNNFQEIIVVGEEMTVREFEVAAADLKVRSLSYRPGSWNAPSVSEQFFRLWGYRPSLEQMLLSASENGHGSAVYQWGLPRADVRAFLAKTAPVSSSELQRQLDRLVKQTLISVKPTTYPVLFLEVGFDGRTRSLAYRIAWFNSGPRLCSLVG